ncbi:DMT family transporter [Limnochorda pilosa]|uniref:Multidrug DMT transporter permease n=1 Tax=Limnochorda pilosa TaxID=1555112 RepID=A0A0K2SHS8_LIMPI|nr:DMT family transporter [Limnochorda pilosa]BAS26404.1 multidrug DMT transporter permease [Limnochorda pilosa]
MDTGQPGHLQPKRVTFVVLILLFCVLWTSAFVATKLALRDGPPLTTAAIRFLVATALLWAGSRATGVRFPTHPREYARLAVLGLLNTGLYLGFTYMALERITAGLTAVIASSHPLAVAVLASRFLGEPVARLPRMGLLLGVLGTVTTLQGRLTASAPQDAASGIALAVAAAASLAIGTVYYRRISGNLHVLAVNTVQLAAAGLFLAPWAWLAERDRTIAWTPLYVGSLAYTVVAVSIGAMVLWYWLLRRGSATAVSSFHFLNPVLGLAMGALVLGEHLEPWDLPGVILVGAGVYLVNAHAGTRSLDAPGSRSRPFEEGSPLHGANVAHDLPHRGGGGELHPGGGATAPDPAGRLGSRPGP